jgi:hypothetical protein
MRDIREEAFCPLPTQLETRNQKLFANHVHREASGLVEDSMDRLPKSNQDEGEFAVILEGARDETAKIVARLIAA